LDPLHAAAELLDKINLSMEEKVLDFLRKHRICSLTTLLIDGSPHAAAVHYSHAKDPLTLYFSTDNTSRKCEALLNGNIVKAAVVVGFSEQEWITLQMNGEIKAVLDKDELAKAQEVHYGKHPKSEKYKNEPETVFLSFTPTWWRYTDYNTIPETVLSSV
jgi:general stress protein 26